MLLKYLFGAAGAHLHLGDGGVTGLHQPSPSGLSPNFQYLPRPLPTSHFYSRETQCKPLHILHPPALSLYPQVPTTLKDEGSRSSWRSWTPCCHLVVSADPKLPAPSRLSFLEACALSLCSRLAFSRSLLTSTCHLHTRGLLSPGH